MTNSITSRVIGPFLGVAPAGEARIFIGLPDSAPASTLNCQVTGLSADIQVSSLRTHGPFGLYAFCVTGLKPGNTYHYGFEMDGTTLDLGPTLSPARCCFVAADEWHADDSFLLMSCHNPFKNEKGSADYGWAMWEQLSRELDRCGSGQRLPKLLILAGDQVYNDDVEEEWLPALAASNNPEDLHSETAEEVRKELISQYTKFWGHASYRRVLAAIPSVAIWDDHDITDGWGGRPESFDPKIPGRFKAEWWTYFQLCREAFTAYQGSRNPPQELSIANPVFTNIFDQGPNRFVLLDFRTEKNTSRRLLWERDHETKVLHALNTTPTDVQRLFVVSPVVPFRTNFEGDRRLSKFSLAFFRIIQWIDQRKKVAWWINFLGRFGFLASLLLGFLLVAGSIFALLWAHLLDILGYWWLYANNLLLLIVTLLTAVTGFCAVASRALNAKELPRLSDDLDDGLSSEINRPVLTKLLRVLFDVQRKGIRVCLLTGDIHTCGMSEIVELRNGDLQSIPQAVASPVAYSPMPKVVEGFTSTTSEMVLSDNGGDYLMARNIFYTSRRNYCEIVPAEFDLPQGAPFRFHLEGYRLPLVMAHQFLRKRNS